jgi:hypothetical protein
MERFRALMEPSPVPEKSATPVNNFSAAPTPVRDPFLERQPAFNPAGRQAVAVEDNVSRPTGIQPLPTLTSKPVQAPAKRPSWQAQLPPWLSDKPQTPSAVHNF